MRIRNWTRAGLVLTALLLASCVGKDGKSYQAYVWSYEPTAFYDTNPSTPYSIQNGVEYYTFRNDVYYSTGTGTFYVQYETPYGDVWGGYYTITKNEGKAILKDGDDLYFEIYLGLDGPILYKYTDARGLTQTNDALKSREAAAAGAPAKSDWPTKRPSGNLGPILGKQTYTTSAGTVTLEYGKVLQ